jgi:hypothetical protein
MPKMPLPKSPRELPTKKAPQALNLDLVAYFKGLKRSYRAVKEATEARVVSWERATGHFFAFLPFEQERGQMQRGTLLAAGARARKNYCLFGFDNENRLILVRKIEGNKPHSEQFLEYVNGTFGIVRGYLYGGTFSARVVALLFNDSGLRASHSLGAEGDRQDEEYSYGSGKLQQISVVRFHSAMKKTFSRRLVFEYAANGAVKIKSLDEQSR